MGVVQDDAVDVDNLKAALRFLKLSKVNSPNKSTGLGKSQFITLTGWLGLDAPVKALLGAAFGELTATSQARRSKRVNGGGWSTEASRPVASPQGFFQNTIVT